MTNDYERSLRKEEEAKAIKRPYITEGGMRDELPRLTVEVEHALIGAEVRVKRAKARILNAYAYAILLLTVLSALLIIVEIVRVLNTPGATFATDTILEIIKTLFKAASKSI